MWNTGRALSFEILLRPVARVQSRLGADEASFSPTNTIPHRFSFSPLTSDTSLRFDAVNLGKVLDLYAFHFTRV